jgi:hypothetical protein
LCYVPALPWFPPLWSSFWGTSWQNVRLLKANPGFSDRLYSVKWLNPYLLEKTGARGSAWVDVVKVFSDQVARIINFKQVFCFRSAQIE